MEKSKTRRVFLGSGLALFGCTQADGRGAGVPLSASEVASNREGAPKGSPPEAAPESPGEEKAQEQVQNLAELEQAIGGRVGVCALLPGTSPGAGRVLLAHRADEPFALCSTFKWGLAALCLRRADLGELELSQRLPFSSDDLQEYAPVARKRLAEGFFTIEQACAAAVELSDNTATNLLLARVGGPEAVTRFFRELGDEATRLDRIEPALNSNLPGDPRDTTTPRAMARSADAALSSELLGVQARALLTRWLVQSRTGDRRLRAGFPGEWTVGGKTGTGGNGAVNDVVTAWPKGSPPLVVAAYLSGSRLPLARLEAAHRRIGELLVEQLALADESGSLKEQ